MWTTIAYYVCRGVGEDQDNDKCVFKKIWIDPRDDYSLIVKSFSCPFIVVTDRVLIDHNCLYYTTCDIKHNLKINTKVLSMLSNKYLNKILIKLIKDRINSYS